MRARDDVQHRRDARVGRTVVAGEPFEVPGMRRIARVCVSDADVFGAERIVPEMSARGTHPQIERGWHLCWPRAPSDWSWFGTAGQIDTGQDDGCQCSHRLDP